jgi:polysaccharide export outer membrane protein
MVGRQSGLITPQTFVYWSIQATEGLPNKLMTGQSLVGPEGMMELGPYGAVKVAGMNADQARNAVEHQLSKFLKNPKVTLNLDAPGQKTSAALTPMGDDTSGVIHHTTLPPPNSGLTTVGWQRGQMADEPSTVDAPAIEIRAMPSQTAKAKENDQKPSDVKGSESGTEKRGLTLAPTTAPSTSAPREIPAELPLKELKDTDRVSQWRPMVRGSDTSTIPLLPQGWDANPSMPVKNVKGLRQSGVISVGAQEKEITLPTPRQTMPKAADSPKSEVIQGPHPHELLGTPGSLVPPSDIGGNVPREGAKVSLPPYVIEPPDILLIESTQKIPDQPIRGQHLVRPDGTVGLGIYGSAYVAGMTIEQAREAIGRTLATRIKDFDLRNLNVDVLAYNSKFYYVITDGAGYGEQVIRMPIMGSETVLDGISQIYGLPAVASKKRIWVARRSADGTTDQVLPVDWCGISQRGSEATNYQIMPGDRIYVDANKWIRFDTKMARFLSPFERVLGITLLGSETVNSISGRTSSGSGGVP